MQQKLTNSLEKHGGKSRNASKPLLLDAILTIFWHHFGILLAYIFGIDFWMYFWMHFLDFPQNWYQNGTRNVTNFSHGALPKRSQNAPGTFLGYPLDFHVILYGFRVIFWCHFNGFGHYFGSYFCWFAVSADSH